MAGEVDGIEVVRLRDPEEDPDEGQPDRRDEDPDEGQAGGGAAAPQQRREEDPQRAEGDGGHEEHEIAAHDVVGGYPAVDEDEGRDRDGGQDEHEYPGQGAEELADDDGDRRDRGRRQQVERLLLALAADRPGRRGRSEDAIISVWSSIRATKMPPSDARRLVGRIEGAEGELVPNVSSARLPDHPGETGDEEEIDGQD